MKARINLTKADFLEHHFPDFRNLFLLDGTGHWFPRCICFHSYNSIQRNLSGLLIERSPGKVWQGAALAIVEGGSSAYFLDE